MAITYGMSVKEFWEDNPDLFWAYRFSYYNDIKLKQEIFNYNAWLQGAYFYEAVSVVLNNAFSKHKLEYPKQPYVLENKESTNKENKQKHIEMQVADIKARISQVNAIKSGTTNNLNVKGGEVSEQ